MNVGASAISALDTPAPVSQAAELIQASLLRKNMDAQSATVATLLEGLPQPQALAPEGTPDADARCDP